MSHDEKRPREFPDYVSYLLRLWREKGGQTTWWRASLQDPHTGERIGFAHLDELVSFLQEQTGHAVTAGNLVKGEHPPERASKFEEGGSE